MSRRGTRAAQWTAMLLFGWLASSSSVAFAQERATETPAASIFDPRALLSAVDFDLSKAPTGKPPASSVAPAARKHAGRAILEEGSFILVSAANYWRKYSTFIEDWQFELNWKDQTRKFFNHEGIRLDSNNMRLNWTHSAAGAIYYSFGRSNGLSAGNSFLFSAVGSFFWEYFAEWREVSSINDHIFTSTGGMAIGEPLFQISRHFRNRPGFGNRVVEFLTNPLVAINDLLDGRKRPARTPADDWHDFRVSFGARSGALMDSGSTGTQGSANLDLQLVALPGYGKAGVDHGYSRDTMDVGAHADVSTLGSGVEEFNIGTRATLFGWWKRNVQQDGSQDSQQRHGYELWYGLQVAWDVFQKKPIVPYDGHDLGMKMRWFPRDTPTQYTDKLAAVHLPGPTLSVTRYDGSWRTRLDLSASVDFSMINALAFNAYSANHDIWGVKTTLHNWGFYYALGPRLAGRIETEYRFLRATAGIDYRHFSSLQHGDRNQDLLLDDSPLTDSRLVMSAGLTAALPHSPVFSTVSVERINRFGRFHTTDARTSETRVSYLLGVKF